MRHEPSPDAAADDSRSPFCWWRSAEEFDGGDNVRLKIDVSNVSNLTPRIKILRELERLALIAPEALYDLRHKLTTYKSGDFWLPTGGIKKEEMNIPPIITILLVGFIGSGKSSLINMMYSVLGRAGLIPFAQASGNSVNYRSNFLEEHNVLRSMRNGFCVFDSRGLDRDRMDESLDGLCEWMVDGIRHRQLCWRSGDDDGSRGGDGRVLSSLKSSGSMYAKRWVNCVVVVANAAEIYRALKGGDSGPLEATRELFHFPPIRRCNENPILILTHGDELSTEERLEARAKICEFLGVSETTGAYDVVCLTEHGILAVESDPVTAYTLTEAIYRALLFSDRSHSPKKSMKDWALVCVSWAMCFISAFFAFLANCFSNLGKKADRFKR
ncbi:uncharacterized protein LOC131225528 [Magnolia sinica]|uniref:uncharacterized protein LOC131225528 n=1 Tax=Magnolia sinica TaxID=86752 RepID=UPI0026596CD6|nr:uncharacterized protein LOC131225528 [Magnolia sinica]